MMQVIRGYRLFYISRTLLFGGERDICGLLSRIKKESEDRGFPHSLLWRCAGWEISLYTVDFSHPVQEQTAGSALQDALSGVGYLSVKRRVTVVFV